MSDDRVALNYFNDVGQKKQPTAAEERALFRELSNARETRAKLDKRAEAGEKSLRRGKIVGPAREAAEQRVAELRRASAKLVKRIAELEGRAAEGYVRFVIKQARRYTRDPQTLRDLIGEGNDGLLVAVKQFNVHLGWRFLTYAVYWIDVRIQEYLNREGVVHVPNHAKKASRKLRKQEEVEMARGLRTHHSFEEPTHAGVDTELLASPAPDDSHENHVIKHMVDAGLDVDHRLVLINAFGLRETEPMGLDELSDYFFAVDGRVFTPDAVKAMKDRASDTLRTHLVSRGVSSASAFV
jgi:RNA polymerase sigma factor (sigma-70 family)